MNRHLEAGHELVVVDNASSDDPAAAVGAWKGEGRLIALDRNAGFGTAANAGTEAARLLVLHAPAMDGYFAELHELWAAPTPPDPADERALMARFGMEPA